MQEKCTRTKRNGGKVFDMEKDGGERKKRKKFRFKKNNLTKALLIIKYDNIYCTKVYN